MFVRALNEKDWTMFKEMRLEALRLSPHTFSSTLEREAAYVDSHWRELLADSRCRIFGLFDGEEMVGLTGVFTDRSDPCGQTAFFGMSYIREEYRGRGYSRLLYEHRLQWAVESGFFRRILVGHRGGNEASRRANQAFGFEYIGFEEKTFGDGRTDILHNYEVRLR